MTIYSSPGDQALGISSSIFGSRLRLGQLDLSGPEARALRADPGHLVDLIEVDENTGAFGHGYFLSNPAVRSDLVAVIIWIEAGHPGRPLVEIRRPYWQIAGAQPEPRLDGRANKKSIGRRPPRRGNASREAGAFADALGSPARSLWGRRARPCGGSGEKIHIAEGD